MTPTGINVPPPAHEKLQKPISLKPELSEVNSQWQVDCGIACTDEAFGYTVRAMSKLKPYLVE